MQHGSVKDLACVFGPHLCVQRMMPCAPIPSNAMALYFSRTTCHTLLLNASPTAQEIARIDPCHPSEEPAGHERVGEDTSRTLMPVSVWLNAISITNMI